MSYIGRFAPSPSGPLHLGSLVAALGSYFQAKSNKGKWLVRIEDLDPPREVPGSNKTILQALEAYCLHWDGEVLYQSNRHDVYQEQINQWLKTGQAYYCQCTRKQIKASGGYYLGTCRDKHIDNGTNCSVRLLVSNYVPSFVDLSQGDIAIPEPLVKEDFIIKRRDGLFAYNLAVVMDDIEQGVTEVVRGADLIEPTGRQISLYKTLEQKPVSYLHLPLVVDASGNKLSKQNHAKAISITEPKADLINAMQILGFTLGDDLQSATIEELINWGCEHWSVKQLPKSIEVTS